MFYPKAEKAPLWCSDALDQADFDTEKYSFHADGCAVSLNEAGDTYTIKSVNNEENIVNITMRKVAPGFQVGQDGTSYFGPDPESPWGSMRHKFWPRCRVEGTFITKSGEIDFAGRGCFVHALQGMKPHHAGIDIQARDARCPADIFAAAKWNFVDFQTPTLSAVMMEYTTPPSYGSTVVNVGGIAADDKIICAGAKNSATHTKAKQDVENEWPEPEAAKFVWSGRNMEDEEVQAVLEGDLGNRLDRIDVMAKVPGIIKSIVGGTVGTRPYIYQYSPDPNWSIQASINGKDLNEEGTLFSEATFIT